MATSAQPATSISENLPVSKKPCGIETDAKSQVQSKVAHIKTVKCQTHGLYQVAAIAADVWDGITFFEYPSLAQAGNFPTESYESSGENFFC